MSNSKTILLNDCSIDAKDSAKIGETLAKIPKVCMNCNKSKKDIVIMLCQCMLCKVCLKDILLGKGDNLLINSFEASIGKEAMCVCPTHNWRIETRFLQAVFTPEELEDYTLNALKRQIKEAKRRKYLWPNVCVDCKGTISESIKNYQSSCHRHKICKECIE